MKNSTLRNLMLDISEMDETSNPLEIVVKMKNALQNGEITFNQYLLLAGDLQTECNRYKIETSNNICSLF